MKFFYVEILLSVSYVLIDNPFGVRFVVDRGPPRRPPSIIRVITNLAPQGTALLQSRISLAPRSRD